MPLSLLALEPRDVPAFFAGAEIAVGADAGSPPLVRLLDPTTQAERTQFLVFDAAFYGGVRVAVGDVTGDRFPDLIAAAGPSGGPVVKVYDGKTGTSTSFYAYAPSFSGGVRVGTAFLSDDRRMDVLTVAGPTGGAQVNVYTSATGDRATSLFGFPSGQATGSFVAGSPVPLNVRPTPGFIVSDAYDQLKKLQQAGRPVIAGPPQTVVVSNQLVVVQPQVPFWTGAGYGLGYGGYGYGLGFPFYDGVGLYGGLGGLYGPGFFGPGYFGSPTFVADPFFYSDLGVPLYDGFFDAFGYPTAAGYLDYLPAEPVVLDPGFVDPGFGYDPAFYDPGFYDYYDPGFSDFGYWDYGGFGDSGGFYW